MSMSKKSLNKLADKLLALEALGTKEAEKQIEQIVLGIMATHDGFETMIELDGIIQSRS